MNLKAEVLQLARYSIMGSLVVILYIGLSALLASYTNFSVQITSALAMIAAFILSYFGHKQFSFRARGDHQLYLKRFMVSVVTISIIHTILMYLTEHYFPNYYYYSVATICVMIPVLSFLINRFVVFNR